MAEVGVRPRQTWPRPNATCASADRRGDPGKEVDAARAPYAPTWPPTNFRRSGQVRAPPTPA